MAWHWARARIASDASAAVAALVSAHHGSCWSRRRCCWCAGACCGGGGNAAWTATITPTASPAAHSHRVGTRGRAPMAAGRTRGRQGLNKELAAGGDRHCREPERTLHKRLPGCGLAQFTQTQHTRAGRWVGGWVGWWVLPASQGTRRGAGGWLLLAKAGGAASVREELAPAHRVGERGRAAPRRRAVHVLCGGLQKGCGARVVALRLCRLCGCGRASGVVNARRARGVQVCPTATARTHGTPPAHPLPSPSPPAV